MTREKERREGTARKFVEQRNATFWRYTLHIDKHLEELTAVFCKAEKDAQDRPRIPAPYVNPNSANLHKSVECVSSGRHGFDKLVKKVCSDGGVSIGLSVCFAQGLQLLNGQGRHSLSATEGRVAVNSEETTERMSSTQLVLPLHDVRACAKKENRLIQKQALINKRYNEGGLHVPGLTYTQVVTLADVNDVFQVAINNRATACTKMNKHSSRSHALLIVTVEGTNITTGAKIIESASWELLSRVLFWSEEKLASFTGRKRRALGCQQQGYREGGRPPDIRPQSGRRRRYRVVEINRGIKRHCHASSKGEIQATEPVRISKKSKQVNQVGNMTSEHLNQDLYEGLVHCCPTDHQQRKNKASEWHTSSVEEKECYPRKMRTSQWVGDVLCPEGQKVAHKDTSSSAHRPCQYRQGHPTICAKVV
ncbi:zonula adherens maintenance [Branchiostoma belcheri]|nr:zonula adherens maintenance [Branchiostoma belcheri]